MLETMILVNLAICLIFGTILVNRKYDLSKLYGTESKSLGVVFLLLMAFTINLIPLVSAADGDNDGVEDGNDDCPDTVAQEGWTVADNGCSYPSYLDSIWLCIGGGVTVQDLTGNDDEECRISLNYDSTYMTVTTPGIANHDMEGGPGGEINSQDYSWKLPLVPANDTTCNPNVSVDGCEMAPDRGPVAVAVNGVPFYGPEDGPGGDAVALEMEMYEETEQVIDLGICGAHSGPGGSYHYHFDGNCMHWHGGPDISEESHDILITDDMKFNSNDLTINVGDAVTWTNNDGMAHTATSTSGPESFNSGNIASGGTWSFTFTNPGVYDYKCNYHSSMTGKIRVVNPWTEYDFSKVDNTVHSPIIGFAFDGYPIYGAYGTVDGEITKMKSNYLLKDGETGSNGIDDYVYNKDNGGHLDACNGVFSVTPEFPEGIYHYHSTVPTAKGSASATNNAFPYFINCYRGIAEMSNSDSGALEGGGPPDDDGDGVGNGWDMCADTPDNSYPNGKPIYPRGCNEEQFLWLSDDNQSIASVAYSGTAPPAPPDDDKDGIPNPEDSCLETESGKLVFKDGCNHGWTTGNNNTNDTDGDGFVDEFDAFPDNSSEWADSDNDGIGDNSDSCQKTNVNTTVDKGGCSDAQKLDTDKDNINNQDDLCPDEDASGNDADGDGCIDDSDNDGIKNNVDECPTDPQNECAVTLQDQQNEVECVEGDRKTKEDGCNTCTCNVDSDGNATWACTEMACEYEGDASSSGVLLTALSCIIIAFVRRK